MSSLYSKNGLIDLAAKSIEENLKYVQSRALQKQLLERLEQLKGQRDASSEIKILEGIYERWAQDFPYIPVDMYLLIEPRYSRQPYFFTLPSKFDAAMEILDDLSLDR